MTLSANAIVSKMINSMYVHYREKLIYSAGHSIDDGRRPEEIAATGRRIRNSKIDAPASSRSARKSASATAVTKR